MRSSIFVIMRKELARFFGDRRMVVSILMPGILIYILYSFMGEAMGESFGVEEHFTPTVYAVELPDSISDLAAAAGMEVFALEPDRVEAAKKQVSAQNYHLLAVFPAGFDQAAADYDPASGERAPQVELYYNSASTESGAAYTVMTGLLEAYEAQLANRFDVNGGEEGYDLATREDAAGTYYSMLLPMLLMMFLYSGCSAVAPESIAGEKERGTIATLLVTPLKRSHLALGKICALSIIALLAGISSAAGTLLSLPKLIQLGGQVSVPYHIGHYLALTVTILSTVLLIVAAVSIISAFAKSTKEAQTYITPLMILVTLVGVTAMFGGGPQQTVSFYLIPFYNTVQVMTGIFSFQMNSAALALTTVSNLVYTGLGVFVLTRMFNSEKLMFQR